MKRFVLILCTMFFCVAAIAQTINIDWKVGNNIYSQSTCEYGSDLNVPTAPTKYGYTFQGWVNYTPIEYLESTGTQYIDTGYIPNNTTEVYTKIMSTGNNDNLFAFGARLAYENSAFGASWQPGGVCYLAFSNNAGMITLTQYKNMIFYNIRMSQKGFFVNNDQVYRYSNASFNAKNNFAIFNLLQGSGALYSATGFTGRIVFFQIYDNDILVRDFIPVLDKNGTPCMFDKVEGKYYYNAGTGQFIAGPVLQ